MLKKYLKGEYDLANSFVIGDRFTDIELAKNIGAKGILIADISKSDLIKKNKLDEFCVLMTEDWDEIYKFLMLGDRKIQLERKTKETDIRVELKS